MADAYDAEFGHAVRAAANGDGARLAEILRSDVPIATGERELLAMLVSGELNPRPGKRSKYPMPDQREAAAEYLHRTKLGEKGEAVAADLAARNRCDESTIKAWVAELRSGLKSAPDPDAALAAVIEQSGYSTE